MEVRSHSLLPHPLHQHQPTLAITCGTAASNIHLFQSNSLLVVTGGCSPFACMHKPNKQAAANPKSTPATAKLKPMLQQQQQQQQKQQERQQASMNKAQAETQKPMAMTRGTSVFSRVRPAKPQKSNQAFDTRQNQLYVAAHTRQPAEQIYDLQRPLIV